MLTQDDLIEYMRHFGYPSHDNGVCMAVALMGMQAILAQDLPCFLRRLDLIEQDLRGGYSFTPQQRSDHEILPFLEGLELNLQPFDYPQYFKPGQAPRTPHPLKSMSVTKSQSIEAQGGIVEATMFTGVYDPLKLFCYFNSFEKSLSTLNDQHPLPLLLRNIDHAMTISFDKNQKRWTVIDANYLPIKYFDNKTDLVDFVMKQFGNEDNKDIIFGTHLMTTKMYQKRAQDFAQMWQRSESFRVAHLHTKTQASAKDSWGVTWLHIAAKQGDAKSVDKLLGMGIDPNQRSKVILPLKFAVLYGHVEIIKKLLANGADPKLQDDGESALQYTRSMRLLNMYKLIRYHHRRLNSHQLKRLQQERIKRASGKAKLNFAAL